MTPVTQALIAQLENLQTTLCSNPSSYVCDLIALENIIENLRAEVAHG